LSARWAQSDLPSIYFLLISFWHFGHVPIFFCTACFDKDDGWSGLNWLACSPYACGLPGVARGLSFGFGRGFTIG
jgi:hypothetical protein